MIHVVQVLTDTNIGGAGRYLLNYLKYYDRSSFHVSVILPEGSQLSEYVKEYNSVNLIEVPFMADQSFDKRCVKHLQSVFQTIKPDILHTHACLSARIAGRKTKVPVILSTRHCIEPLPHGLKALLFSYFNNVLCDYYIAVSEAVVNNLLECGIKNNKILVVNNGVEPMKKISEAEILSIRKQYGISAEDKVFGIFARLEPVKGHKYFIKAARQVLKEVSNVKFLVVGNGSLEKELRDQVSRYGLDENFIFTGFVSNTSELLNVVDVNVNASESEAMSLSILEAMSLGKASIATNAGGNPELVEHNKDGLLVGYADSASLSLAMMRLIQNRELLNELSEHAYQKYQENYTVETMVLRLEKVYKEVMKND